MKNFSTWMIVLFMIMFWVFRIIVALSAEFQMDIGFTPLNKQLEIILLFITLVCILLVIKRKMLGGLLYLLSYGMYFGVDLFQNIKVMIENTEETTLAINVYTGVFISFLAMILVLAVMLDLLVDKSRKLNPKDKKTDWFYKNEDYDRKMDDRADKNNYRTL